MVRTFQITKALARMPVIDNMTLASPNQPGEKLRNVVFRPSRCRRREREVSDQAMELLEISISTASRTSTPARCRAASASCWSWPGR